MASDSWTFSTANKYITGRIRWTSRSNGNLYNSSNVTVYLDYKKSSKSTDNTNGGYTGVLYCGGQTYSFKLSSSKFYLKCDDKWVNMASHTFTVKHSRTGTCNVTLGLQGGHCTNGNSLSDPQTSTKTFTLDAITLYAPTFKTLTIDNVTQTSFRVNWAVNTYYNKVEYNINGGSYSLLSSSTGSSGSFTVSSRSPSTKYTIGVRVTRTDATSKVSTKTASATTVAIPQVNIPSLNFTLESEASNLNIEVTGLDKGSVKLTCSYTTDTGSTIKLLDNVQIEQESAATIGGIGLDLSDDAILEQIYSNCKNTSKIPIKLTTTITGTSNNVYNNSYEGKMTVPTEYKPSFTGFTCTNVDTKTLNMLGGKNNNAYIPQGYGKMRVKIPVNAAVGQKYANIANYKINLRSSNGALIGSTVTKAYSSTDSVIHDIGTTDTPGTYIVEICATDSRGYDSSICTQEFIVLPYTKPEIGVQDLVLSRVNNFEKELILHLQGSYSSLLIGNTSYNSIIISYKGQNITNSVVAIDDASTIEGTLPITSKNQGDNTSFVYTFNDKRFYKGDEQTDDNIISIDPSQIWKFVFTITDNLSSFPRDATIEQGSPIMAVVDNGMVGINMVPDVEDTSVKLQVNGDISSVKEDGTSVKFLELVEIVENLWQRFYPVGSIYMSVENTNPSTFIGGTWVAWGAGRVPVGVNTGDSNFNTVEKTGGASTHTLTEAQMPAHTHTVSGTAASNGAHRHRAGYKRQDNYGSGALDAMHWSDYSDGSVSTSTDGAHTHTVSGTAASKGSGKAHNNLQPYITCYMWKRTA